MRAAQQLNCQYCLLFVYEFIIYRFSDSGQRLNIYIVANISYFYWKFQAKLCSFGAPAIFFFTFVLDHECICLHESIKLKFTFYQYSSKHHICIKSTISEKLGSNVVERGKGFIYSGRHNICIKPSNLSERLSIFRSKQFNHATYVCSFTSFFLMNYSKRILCTLGNVII